MKSMESQYKNSSNLNARIKIHDLYSTNPQDWHEWLFDQYQIPEGSSVLELGCGNGAFWLKNQQLVSSGWNITLTDFSHGMLEELKQQLPIHDQFTYEQVNIQEIPFESNSFDVIIANHMLYHVEDIDQALSEVHRVLKDDGTFYCSTIGNSHLKEFEELVKGFDQRLGYPSAHIHANVFGLENGEDKLRKHFTKVRSTEFEDQLDIPETQPIIDYLQSTTDELKIFLNGESLDQFVHYLEDVKKRHNGVISVTKSSGYFEAVK